MPLGRSQIGSGPCPGGTRSTGGGYQAYDRLLGFCPSRWVWANSAWFHVSRSHALGNYHAKGGRYGGPGSQDTQKVDLNSVWPNFLVSYHRRTGLQVGQGPACVAHRSVDLVVIGPGRHGGSITGLRGRFCSNPVGSPSLGSPRVGLPPFCPSTHPLVGDLRGWRI